MPPTKIGRYEIKSELGRGGMATVYRAYDPSFERDVAIKVLPSELLHDPQFRERFKREIKTIAALEHPAIVPVYDVGEEDGVPYFVMRYMPGGSLSNWIEKGKFSLQDAARIIERLASALAYAHKNGIVHRDLKPDNILFDNNGDPFISDFGVAKLTDSATNMTGSGIIGTPAYMSPEQAQGEPVDNRSDIYGLGVIIFQMLSGKQPYNATTPMGVAVKHITEPVPEILKANPALPVATDTIIKTAMAKNRDNRYPTATALSQAMNKVAFDNKEKSSSHPGADGSAPPARGSKLGYIIGGVVLLLIVLAAGFLFRNKLFSPSGGPLLVQASMTSIRTAVPPASLTSTLILVTTTVAPTKAPASTVAALLAPVCKPAILAQFPTPAISVFNRGCTKKFPYTILTIPQGATFESQSPDMTCTDTGAHNADRQISCAGINPFSYSLKICNPVPTPLPSVAGGKCLSGTNFDSANQCCVAPDQESTCTIFQVDMRTCTS